MENPVVKGLFSHGLASPSSRHWRPVARTPAGAPKPKLLDQVRQALRARHYSRRTEEAYVFWIKRFIFFHGVRHPAGMGESEINQFLTDLAVNKKVSASTQNQAKSRPQTSDQKVRNPQSAIRNQFERPVVSVPTRPESTPRLD
jgi:hypothetical protein